MMFHPSRLFRHTAHRFALTALALLLCTLAFQASAQLDLRPDDPAANPDEWLLDARWGEVRYGLTIREPIDSLRMDQPPDQAVARWVVPNGPRVSLEIHQGMLANHTLYANLDDDVDDPFNAVGGGDIPQEQTVLRLNTLISDLSGAIEAAFAQDVINSELHKWIEVGPYIGYINYFVVDPRGDESPPWLYGIALIQLDDFNVVVLRLECALEEAEQGVCTFESMVHSVEVESSENARRRLRGWMIEGDTFLAGVSQAQRQAAMRPDRLYRIMELRPARDGNTQEADIGYLRIWQRHQDAGYYDRLLADLRRERQDPSARLEGIDGFRTPGDALVIQSFYQARGTQINRLYEYIDADSDQGIDELWNLKTEMRQPGAGRYGRDEGVWVETGVRDELNVDGRTLGGRNINRIQVIREGTPPRRLTEYVLNRERDPDRRLRFPSARPGALPAGDVSTLQWQTPDRGYLSQVDAMLVPALLPAEEATYGFFVYHADSSALAIRVMRVVPKDDGGKYVFIRPTIDLAEQAMEFDANGELVRWYFPDGRSMVRTTREELARIWNVRLPRD